MRPLILFKRVILLSDPHILFCLNADTSARIVSISILVSAPMSVSPSLAVTIAPTPTVPVPLLYRDLVDDILEIALTFASILRGSAVLHDL